MDRRELRQRIRQRLATGELPADHPQNTWVGRGGTGQTCAICDAVISGDAIEVEALSADDKVRHYHRECFVILHEERGRS